MKLFQDNHLRVEAKIFLETINYFDIILIYL